VAHVWATVATWQGNEVALETRNTAATRLTKELMARGERVAAEYWELFVVPFMAA
jgi:hypothetical protein